MKLSNKFTKFAVFTILFVLMSMAFAVITAMAAPTQPAYTVNIVPRVTAVSYPGEVALDIHISRLPYADNFGPHGIGWFAFHFDLYFDHTRFEPIPYLPGGNIHALAASDFSTWLDVNGSPVHQPGVLTRLSPGAVQNPAGTLRVMLESFDEQIVMTDVVVHLRFRVLPGARMGNALFSWGNAPGGVGARCPLSPRGHNMHSLRIYGPCDTNFGIVNVLAAGTPTQPTHNINIVPRVTDVRYPDEVALDIYISRLPYADSFGNYGIGWFAFHFDLYFDETRFEPIPYSAGGNRYTLAESDFDTWLDVNGFPVRNVNLHTRLNPIGGGNPNGTIRVMLDLFNEHIVMTDVVVHLRFRVIETASAGNDVLFSWGPATGGVGGRCPNLPRGHGLHTLGINGPHDVDFGRVNVLLNLPCYDTNLARDIRTVMTASSEVGPRRSPVFANNGVRHNTLVADFSWQAAGVGNEWLMADFGRQRNFNTVRIYQAGMRIRDYRFEYSNDGVTWNTFRAGHQIIVESPNYYEVRVPDTTQARFVRLFSERSNHATTGIAVWEFEVYYMP